MASLTVRNLPDEVHRALRVRAAEHGRSTEAEVRHILSLAVQPISEIGFGDELAAIGRQFGVHDDDIEALEKTRDRTPAQPVTFE